jgi:hypothetical protein
MRNLCDQGFYSWALETRAALRCGRIAEVDLDHVAEEIEGMANRDLRELNSRLERIVEHKLKLQLIGGPLSERHEAAWAGSIFWPRAAMEDLVAHSPSLRPPIPELISSAYENAAHVVAKSVRVATPADCPWDQEEILK